MLTPVIPIASGKKGPPFVKDWPHASLEALEEALEKYQGCNLALRLDRYLALDPDDQEAAKFLVRLEREGKLPPTVAWETWRGMIIRLYRRPDGLEPVKPNGSGMKLEIRTSPGQYVLIPDSIVNGKKYRWLPDVGPADIEVAELPEATLSFIKGTLARHGETKPVASSTVSPWAELWQGLPKGSRNDAAAKLSGRLLGRGIAGDEALEILRAWNSNNSPPLAEAELVRTLQSIAKAEERKGKKDDAPTVLTATQLLARTLQKPPEIIGEGIFPEGAGMLVTGESGVGKSLLTLEMAVRLSHGIELYGLEVPRPRRILMVQSENPLHSVQFRLRRILVGLEVQGAPNVMLVDPAFRIDLANRKSLQDLKNILENSRAEVVVLDPLSSYHRTNENDNVAMRGLLDNLTHLSRLTGCAWIVVHHHGKPQDGTRDIWQYRGASSIRDWADTMIALLNKKGMDKQILRLMRFDKIRNGPDRPPILLDRNQNFIHWPTQEDVLVPHTLVVATLEEMGGEAKSQRALSEEISKRAGCSLSTARRGVENAMNTWIVLKGGKVLIKQ
ncbi:MAG: AAA family ATPase [Syntrophales bacterium]|nr:AAA family ATPase [Syntrophales bacterium]MDD5641712.1 AAA family ATPase [Syntrophales bacterium]